MTQLPELRENFAPFRDYLGEMQGRINSSEDVRSVPGYQDDLLTDGAQLTVLAVPPELSDNENQRYIAQIFSVDPESEGEPSPLAEQVETHAQIMARAVGHTGLEQIVAYE
jgi:hypothetical protein